MIKCPSCKGSTFGTQEFVPAGSNYKLVAVKCNSCSSVVSVIDYMNIGAVLGQHGNELKQIKAQITDLQNALRRLQR